MRKLFDYKCLSCKHNFEEYADYNEIVECPLCGANAKRLTTGGHFKLNGADLSFPTAAMKWDKRHSKEAVDKIVAKKQG